MKENIHKIVVLVLMAAALTFVPSSADTQSATGIHKMELPLRMLLETPAQGRAVLGKAVKASGGVELVDIIIKTSDAELTKASVEDAGGRVRSVVGNIMTAGVPAGELASISALPEVIAIEASRPMKLMMDTARSSSNTDVASLQTTYGGADVVVGAIDSGLDYEHSDFTGAGGSIRVQYIRFQTVQSDGSVSITECAKDYMEGGECSIPATNDSAVGHGTHILGIAAGSDDTYTGVAPAADVMLVRNDFDDDISEGNASSGTFSGGVIDGVVQIFEKADILDKPAVINISQGTHIGAHDDTSLLEESLNSAVTGGYATGGRGYGRIIAAAAGNEYIVTDSVQGSGAKSGGIHAEINVPAGSSHAWRLWVLLASDVGRTPLAMDAWFGAGQSASCTVAANAYKYDDIFVDPFAPPVAATTDPAVVSVADLALSGDNSGSDDDGTAALAAATDPSDSLNGRPRALFLFGPTTTSSWDDIAIFDSAGVQNPQANWYFLDVIVRAGGGSCSGDMWIEGGGTYVNFMAGIDTFTVGDGTNGAGYDIRDGDSNQTVAIPGTASGVIAVGSYLQTKPVTGCSDSCWRDIDGSYHDATDALALAATQAQVTGGTVQARSPFSSIGPPAYSYSGRKPDVMAPGDPILSARPEGVTPASDGAANNMVIIDSEHYKSQGTSQACPHVAGIIALMLEKNNTLTASQVKSALTSTASRSASPDNQVGYGNVDAPGALAAVSPDTSGYSGTGDLSQSDLNGGGGSTSSSCGGTIAPPTVGSASPVALIALIPLLLLAVRRDEKL